MIDSNEIHKKYANPDGTINLNKFIDEVWENARYLVSTSRPSDKFTGTNQSYYKGYTVFPAPKADERITGRLEITDYPILLQTYGIRLFNHEATSGSDKETVMADWAIMDDAEADEFEKINLEAMGIEKPKTSKKNLDDLLDEKPKRANSKTAK